jgi:DNA repair exonuclease SbcCD ATPase subunit
MPSLKELQLIAERCESAANELRQHVVTFANLEQEFERAEQTLAGLRGKIAQAEPLTKQIDELDQTIRRKRAELAELDAIVAKKHEDHGKIDGDLRSIQKRIESWAT